MLEICSRRLERTAANVKQMWHSELMTTIPAALGSRLREVRETAGHSLREMERRSGLNNGYLSQLEQGKISHPGPAILRKVAEAYDLRFEDVLSWAGYAPDDQPGLRPREAMALSSVTSLGEPSDSELQALQAIVKLLQQNRAKAGG